MPRRPPQAVETRPAQATTPPNPLPPESVTAHVLELPDRALHFTAKAGAVRLSDAQSGNPLADIGYVAFMLDGADPTKRPLTFAINGGPGSASAWLDLGAMGPWRVRLDGAALTPSAPPVTLDNRDTWLDFTDIVFIDPVGTGYSRFLGKEDELRKQFYSVNGDIDSLAVVIRKWLVENGRLQSPKFIVGESYGGFRAPKLARRLQDQEGIGIQGLVLVSPVLDFGWYSGGPNSPMSYVTHLPSLTAVARGLDGKDGRKPLADVEAYAAGPYLVDLLRGERDPQALARMSDAVAKFTGLDPTIVRQLGGRVDSFSFLRERERAGERIASLYDGGVTGFDPSPHAATTEYSDPVLDAAKTVLASAMADITAHRLNYPIDARYEILNESVTHQWDWAGGRNRAEALGDLKRALALDPQMRVLIAHGIADQVTPYFASKMLIDQVPPMGDPDRLRLVVYGGGHMLYTVDRSRAALREDARKLIQGE